jgi:hypothetical protein
MPGSAAHGELISALAGLVVLNTLIGAFFLQAACALFNRLSKRYLLMSRVPEPRFGKAMGITFVTTVLGLIAGVVICGPSLGRDDAAPRSRGGDTVLATEVLSLLAGILVMTAMNAKLLPTTFFRGFLVALCDLVVVLFVVGVLLVSFGGIALVYWLLR